MIEIAIFFEFSLIFCVLGFLLVISDEKKNFGRCILPVIKFRAMTKKRLKIYILIGNVSNMFEEKLKKKERKRRK